MRLPLIRSNALRNTAYNYLGIIWRAGLSVLLIPFYVHHLPAAEWGIVAFCVALQAMLALLDAGLGQIIPRDIARAGEAAALAKRFAVFSRAYFCLALLALLVGQLAAPWLARDWLQLSVGPSDEAVFALRMAFVMFFFQFWNSVHFGFWNGTQEQRLLNVRQTLFATLKHGTAAALVLLWSPTATSYLVAFTVLSAAEWLSNRLSIGRKLAAHRVPVTRADLLALTHETGLLSLAILVGMAVSQVDRFALSKMVSIEDYGRYVAVASLGLAFFQLQAPVLNAFLPRLATELPRGNSASLRSLTRAILALNVLPCLAIAAAVPVILSMWIKDPVIQSVGVLPLRLILLAVAVNAVYQIFYQQMLVMGLARSILSINCINLVVLIAFMAAATPGLGLAAGGWAWLLASSVQLVSGSAVVALRRGWRHDADADDVARRQGPSA